MICISPSGGQVMRSFGDKSLRLICIANEWTAAVLLVYASYLERAGLVYLSDVLS